MKSLRRHFLAAPLFLPLVAAVGAVPGGWWLVVSAGAVLVALLCRVWRIALCSLLCALVAGLHTRLLEVICRDSNPEAAVTTLLECVVPMLAEYGTCLEHNHRAFISPKLSLVATCEPRGPQGSMVLCMTLDHTHYRD